MAGRLVTEFGGNGFVGRHIVQRLANRGDRVRIACRDPESALFLKPLGDPGQILLIKANVGVMAEVERAVKGVDAVVNCVGLLAPSGRNTFQRAHVEGAGNVAKAAKAAGVKSLVQISSLAADPDSKSDYARTKSAGENSVLDAFPEAVILRPSIIIGPEDGFMNMFAKIARWSPVVPIIGGSILPKFKMEAGTGTEWKFPTFEFSDLGGTHFQPIFVGDVADAVIKGLDSCAGVDGAQGKVFELAGPRVYTFRRLMKMMLKAIKRSRLVLPYPTPLAYIAAFFMEFIPGKPLTRDQVTLLQTDNVLSGENLTIQDLGLEPRGIDSVLPSYLSAYQPPSGRRDRMHEA
ncbi:MAG: complex I NDUFA9 subunit family protein [Magnetovibrio sp.]|nr:complex I NDUFA9 subunit family protein [Magnetovibrio sp.]